MAIPTVETIDRFDREWTQCESEIKAIRKRKTDAVKDLRSLENDLERLESVDVIPTESELADQRTTRDVGWKLFERHGLKEAKTRPPSPDSLSNFQNPPFIGSI